MLIIWDRMFGKYLVYSTCDHYLIPYFSIGTFQPEEDRVIYGLVHSTDTWNPLHNQFSTYWELLKRFYQTEGFKHKLCVLFMGPGWSPGTPRLGNGVPEVTCIPAL